jgi:virulence-associated protein VapD
MYSSLPHFVIAFHGCDKSVANKVVSRTNPHLISSKNKYDWLGHGIYFWEQNYHRALDFATQIKDHPEHRPIGSRPIKTPSAVGAVIDLGKCLNLLDENYIDYVKKVYLDIKDVSRELGWNLPKNIGAARYLDCYVMNMVNTYTATIGEKKFDSVRGMFPEGSPLYKKSGFLNKSHIQICIINPNCIKGYFHPVTIDPNYPHP